MKATHRNNVKMAGDGYRTSTFAHGYECDQNIWRHVFPAFPDEFKVVSFDYVGSGASDASASDKSKYSTLRGYAQDVLDIVREPDYKDVNSSAIQ